MAEGPVTPKFTIPPEPQPVPVVSSDDESFVVLGTSMTTDFNGMSIENSPAISIIQDAKQLLKEELDKISLNIGPEPSSEKLWKTPQESLTNGDVPEQSTSKLPSDMTLSQLESSASITPAFPQFDNNDASHAISMYSFSPADFRSEDLQIKVSQIIEENINLKNTLIKNNESMKNHHQKITAWKETVENTHKNNKERLLQCFDKLKQDNLAIRQGLETALKVSRDEIITNQKKYEEALQQETNKQLLLENKIGEFEKELEQTYKTIKELQAYRDSQFGESDMLKLLQDRTQKEISFLQTKVAKSLCYSEEAEYCKAEMARMEKMLELKEKEIREAKQMLDLTEDRLEKVTQENEGYGKNIAELETYIEQLNARYESFRKDVYSQRESAQRSSASNMTDSLQKRLDQVQLELREVQDKLKKKECDNYILAVEKKFADESGAAAAAEIKRLEDRERELSEMLSRKQNPPQNGEDVAYLRQQLMQSQKVITEYDQIRIQAQATVDKLEKRITELTGQLEQRTADADIVFALQTQLEVYKNDFEAERNAKEEMKQEKSKIAEDLQNLLRRNQQMLEEIEFYRLNTNGPRYRASQSEMGTGASPSSPPMVRYTCPICSINFRSLKLVQDHLDTCVCHAPW